MGLHELKELSSVLTCHIPSVIALTAFGTALVIMLWFIRRRLSTTDCLDMPEPFPFPFIGCMYLFKWSSHPHKTLAWLTKIYGNVYSLNLAGTNVVVVNSLDSIKEVLYRKSKDFAGRPQLFTFNLWSWNESLMFKDYGTEFLQRKCKAEMSLQELFNKEELTIARLKKAVKSLDDTFTIYEVEKTAFNPFNSIRCVVSDLVMDCIFGHHISRLFYNEARVVLEQASTEYVKTAYVGACIDFVSIIRYFSKKTLNSTRFEVARLHDFVRKVYQLHKGSFVQHPDHTASLAFILRSKNKGYRKHGEKSLTNTSLNDDIIVAMLTDIMFNAYEKISTCFGWCIKRLSSNLNLQREIQQELTNDFQRDDTRLLTATINEVIRTSCVLPLGIPRKTTKDTTLNGYKIHNNTLVFLNMWSCCNDANKFSNPWEFNPYRFISSSKENHSELFPLFCCFSGGERKCLGGTMTRRILVGLTGGILKEYNLELATPRKDWGVDGCYGWTLRPSNYTINVQKTVKQNKHDDDR